MLYQHSEVNRHRGYCSRSFVNGLTSHAFDDESAVSQMRPAVVEDDRRERWSRSGRRRDAKDALYDALNR